MAISTERLVFIETDAEQAAGSGIKSTAYMRYYNAATRARASTEDFTVDTIGIDNRYQTGVYSGDRFVFSQDINSFSSDPAAPITKLIFYNSATKTRISAEDIILPQGFIHGANDIDYSFATDNRIIFGRSGSGGHNSLDDHDLYILNKSTKVYLPNETITFEDSDDQVINFGFYTNDRLVFVGTKRIGGSDIAYAFFYNKETRVKYSEDIALYRASNDYTAGFVADGKYYFCINHWIEVYDQATRARIPSEEINNLGGGYVVNTLVTPIKALVTNDRIVVLYKYTVSNSVSYKVDFFNRFTRERIPSETITLVQNFTNSVQVVNDAYVDMLYVKSANSVSATITAPSTKQTSQYTCQISFIQSVALFTIDDVEIVNLGTGTATLSGSGKDYTLTITPANNAIGTHEIHLTGEVNVGGTPNHISATSASVNFDTLITPNAITDLTAVAEGTGGVRLSFTAHTDTFTRYEYRYKTTGNYSAWQLAAKSNSILVSSLPKGISHTFQVRIDNNGVYSSESNEATATPLGVSDAPSGLSASAGNRIVDLSYGPPTNNGGNAILRYEYRYKLNTANTWSNWVNNALNLTAQIKGLLNTRLYNFEVRAITAQGNGISVTINATPLQDSVAAMFTNYTGDKKGNFSVGVDFSNSGTGSAAVDGFTIADITIVRVSGDSPTLTDAGIDDFTITANGDNRYNINFTPATDKNIVFNLDISGQVSISGVVHNVAISGVNITVDTRTDISATWDNIAGVKVGAAFTFKILFVRNISGLTKDDFILTDVSGDTLAQAGLNDWTLREISGSSYSLEFTPSIGYQGFFSIDVDGRVLDGTISRAVDIPSATIQFNTTGTIPLLERPTVVISAAEQPLGTLAPDPVANNSTVFFDIVWNENVGSEFTHADIEIWESTAAGGTNPLAINLTNVGMQGTTTHFRLAHVIPASGDGELIIRIRENAYKNSLPKDSHIVFYGQRTDGLDISWDVPTSIQTAPFDIGITFSNPVGSTKRVDNTLSEEDIIIYGAPMGTTKTLTKNSPISYTLRVSPPQGVNCVISPAVDTDDLILIFLITDWDYGGDGVTDWYYGASGTDWIYGS